MSTIVASRPRAATNASFRPQRLSRRDQENPFATVLRETPLPTIITDPSGFDNPIVFANAAFCRMTGYRPHEILGRNCRFLQGADTDPVAVARIFAALQEKKSIEIEIRNYRKNGSAFWNRLLIAPVYSETGSLAYFFASQIDVTAEHDQPQHDRPQHEWPQDHGRATEKLQAAIRERDRVEAALQRLHTVEEICHLAGGIAHNFTNLLGGMRGSLAMLQRGIADPSSIRDRSATPCSGQIG